MCNYKAYSNLNFSEILAQHLLSYTLEKLLDVLKGTINFYGSESACVLLAK